MPRINVEYRQRFNHILYSDPKNHVDSIVAELVGTLTDINFHGLILSQAGTLLSYLRHAINHVNSKDEKYRDMRALLNKFDGDLCEFEGCKDGKYSGKYCRRHYNQGKEAERKRRMDEWREEKAKKEALSDSSS